MKPSGRRFSFCAQAVLMARWAKAMQSHELLPLKFFFFVLQTASVLSGLAVRTSDYVEPGIQSGICRRHFSLWRKPVWPNVRDPRPASGRGVETVRLVSEDSRGTGCLDGSRRSDSNAAIHFTENGQRGFAWDLSRMLRLVSFREANGPDWINKQKSDSGNSCRAFQPPWSIPTDGRNLKLLHRRTAARKCQPHHGKS